MSTLDLALAFAAAFVAIAVPAIATAFYFRGRLARLEAQTAAYAQTVGHVVGALAVMSPDMEPLRLLARDIAMPAFPLPDGLVARVEYFDRTGYVRMAQNGEQFTADQVRAFNGLIASYKQDHPRDPSVNGLLLLGAFLVGLYVGPRDVPRVSTRPSDGITVPPLADRRNR